VIALAGLGYTADETVAGDRLGAGTQAYEIAVDAPPDTAHTVRVAFPEADDAHAHRVLGRLGEELASADVVDVLDRDAATIEVSGTGHRTVEAQIPVYGFEEARQVFEHYGYERIELNATSPVAATVNGTVMLAIDDGPTPNCFATASLTGEVTTSGDGRANATRMHPAGIAADPNRTGLPAGFLPVECEQ